MNDRSAVGIRLEDLEVMSEAIMLRLAESDQEALRVGRMRELLWVASELTRALATHTQHSLVDCCGTHGTGDLASDTRALHDALTRYAHLVHQAAVDYRPVVRPDADVRMLRAERPQPRYAAKAV